MLKSTYADGFHFNPMLIVINELTIVGSRCGPFDKALEMLEKKLIDPSKLVDDRYKFDDALKAFDSAKTKGVLKVLLDFEE